MDRHTFAIIKRHRLDDLRKRGVVAELNRIAAENDVSFVGPASVPGNDSVAWFSMRDFGSAINRSTMDRIMSDIDDAGLGHLYGRQQPEPSDIDDEDDE